MRPAPRAIRALPFLLSVLLAAAPASRGTTVVRSKSNIRNNRAMATTACGIDCVDIQALPPASYPGPKFSLGGLEFTNPTAAGAPAKVEIVDRAEAHDGNPELYLGRSDGASGRTPLLVTFPHADFPRGVCSVVIDVQHWAQQLKIEALDAAGAVVATATQSAPKHRVKLHLDAPAIQQLRFTAVEAHVYGICWSE